MRHALFALALDVVGLGLRRMTIVFLMLLSLATGAAAFEVEEDTQFPGGPAQLAILGNTDTVVFAPLIAAFQQRRPDVTVRYVAASASELYVALHDDQVPFDLAISSAMDLQMKLANDGFGLSYSSAQTEALPVWARWRDQLFAVAQEPVVVLASRTAFDGLVMPTTRAEMVALLRDNPDRFAGKIGTYDAEKSGVGYLFATQDARQSDTSWRLTEVAGRLQPKLYLNSARMIDDVQSGELALAYNVLGSYAAARPSDDMVVIGPQDFTHVLLRTALIPQTSESPELGQTFLDFLLSDTGQALLTAQGLPQINAASLQEGVALRPIRLDPGLLVYLDPLMRSRFLTEWTASIKQP